MSGPRPAVVLLSGGLDSTTLLAIAGREGYELNAMTFNYGQRHAVEIQAAERVAKQFNVGRHIIVPINLRVIGGSALTDNLVVPKDRPMEEISEGIPNTYVPARNTIFLSFALAWAEVLECNDVFIGVNALDYSGYPDCRPEFIAAFQTMARLATKAGVEGKHRLTIHTPLIDKTKSEIIGRGMQLGVDYSLTRSCYDPIDTETACGLCDSCRLRLKGFNEAGFTDPIHYASR